MENNSKVLGLQYDFGVASTAIAGKLLELMKAASEDNVQAQAVMTLHAIGGMVHPSSELIGKAVNALGGSKNVNLVNMQLVLGITSNTTASWLRQSTPGLAGFLLVTALKLVYQENSVGEILYEIAAKSAILHSYPTSSQQLTQVADALSGHACLILPVDHLNTISSILLDQNLDAATRKLMTAALDSKSLGGLLFWIFSGLLDAEIDKLVIEGVHAATSLASILTWLFPEHVLIVHDEKVIHGPPDAKMVIQLQKAQDHGPKIVSDSVWKTSKWRKEVSVQNLLLLMNQSREDRIVPKKAYRNMLQSYCGLESKHMGILGQVAGAILRLTVETGQLVHKLNSVECRVPLLELCSDWFLREYTSLMKFYGWSHDELAPENIVHERIKNWMRLQPKQSAGVHKLEQYLKDLIEAAWGQAGLDTGHVPLWEIVHLVEDSLSFSCLQEDVHTFLAFKASFWKQSVELKLPVVLGEDLSVDAFRKMVLGSIIPQYDKGADDLIVAGNGLVVWPRILDEYSCDRKAALALNCMPGCIKRGYERYSVVRENHSTSTSFSQREISGIVNPFHGEKYVGLYPLPGIITSEFHVSSRSDGPFLYLQIRISFQNTEVQDGYAELERSWGPEIAANSFSWIRVMNSLFRLTFLGKNDGMTRMGEESLAKRIWSSYDSCTADYPEWISGDSGLPTHLPTSRKYIACTNGDVLLRLFQLSQSFCLHQVLCHEASLIKAVSIANERADQWIIIL